MKKIFFLLPFLFNNLAHANGPLIDLNSQNLTLMALNSSSQEDLDKYVLDLLKTKHSDEYYPVRKDPKKLAILKLKYSNKVKASASKFSHQTRFKWAQGVRYEIFNADQSLLTIKNFIYGSSKAIQVDSNNGNGLPSSFVLLFPNINIIKDIKVDSEKFQSLINNRKNKKNKQLYLEMTLVLPKLQNRDNFQTVIKEINVYESPKKRILIASKKETENSEDLINNWLLSDGFSNKLIGIHAFSFLGYRLQDMMKDVDSIKQYCNKTQKIGRHQVVICNLPYSENSLLITTYIGGNVAKIDLVAKSALSNKEKKQISNTIMLKLKQTKSIFNESKVQWSKYHSDFVFYSDAFFGEKSKESKYVYALAGADNQKNTDLTLIVSMISQATKKLIENNK